MLAPEIYTRRRERLKEQVGSGLLLFLGNEESPMNYPANPYPFRQDSSFLYFFGLDSPSLAGVVDVDEGRDILFGDDVGVKDIIWMGDLPLLKDRALQAGVKETTLLAKLGEVLAAAREKGRTVHYLPPYPPEKVLKIADLLGISPDETRKKVSEALIKAVVEQRSIKIPEEILIGNSFFCLRQIPHNYPQFPPFIRPRQDYHTQTDKVNDSTNHTNPPKSPNPSSFS